MANKTAYKIHFTDTKHPPLTVGTGELLGDVLSPDNSPVLFGCRGGVCGTCLIQVDALDGELPPPRPQEAETLAMMAPGDDKARLACQLPLTCDIALKIVRY